MKDEKGKLVREDGEKLAWRRVSTSERKGGRTASTIKPAIVWLSGFKSDMNGGKAQALATWAGETGRECLLFDYFGHGRSSGEFAAGNITRWRADTLAAIDELTTGPLVLVGSSMGGWLACLAAIARPERVAGLVLVAPAADFIDKLMRPSLPAEALTALEQTGVWMRPSLYDGGGYPITRQLLEDGVRWSILPGPVPITAPVRILQGAQDPDVPWTHALELANSLKGEDVVFTLIRDGDHRLSRDADIARLIAAVEELCG
jgi:pimeloyl-ACP methyl ester carboxylesterase